MASQSDKQSNTGTSPKQVSCKKFNINNLFIAPFNPSKQQSGKLQKTLFPQYTYADGKKTTLRLITNSIIMKGLIPKVDPDSAFNKTANNCLYFLIYKNDEDPNNVELFNVLQEIDTYYEKKINKEKNKNNLITMFKGKEIIPFKKLAYGKNDDKNKDDDDNDNENGDDNEDDNTNDKSSYIVKSKIDKKTETISTIP